MKKNQFRVLSSMFAFLAVCSVSACGDSAELPSQDNTTSGVSLENTTAAESTIYDVLPEKDYKQYTFRILNNLSNFAYTNIGEDGQTGESLDDAIYNRNLAVESALNISFQIVAKEWEDTKDTISTAVAAGEDLYDMYFCDLSVVLGHALNGYLVDLSGIESLNFENPWWSTTAIDSVSIGDTIYAAFGDLHVGYYESYVPLVFNKSILTELDLADPYQLVREGTWTIDAMVAMMKEAKNDVDGDGKWTVADRYAFGIMEHNVGAFLTSADASIITKDNENLPVWEGLSDRYQTVYNKLATTIFEDKKNNADNASGYSSDSDLQQLHGMTLDGSVLFYIEPLGSVKKMRNADFEVGVVPMPKYDENQEEYRSYIFSSANAMAIPKTNPDVERTGVIVDYMSAYSHEGVRDTYFNETLDFKYIQDEESQEMLDIIFKNGYFELADVYGWGDLSSKIKTSLYSGRADVVSRVERVSAKVDAEISETLVAFEEAQS